MVGICRVFLMSWSYKTYGKNLKYIEIQSMHRPSQSCCSFLCCIMYTPIQFLPAECRSSHSGKSQASSSSKRLEYKYVIRGPHGVKPPTRTGWTASGTSAEIWANLWAVWSPFLRFLRAIWGSEIRNTHGLCCFPGFKAVDISAVIPITALGAAEVGAWQQSLGSC
jgi:hypothetical protein